MFVGLKSYRIKLLKVRLKPPDNEVKGTVLALDFDPEDELKTKRSYVQNHILSDVASIKHLLSKQEHNSTITVLWRMLSDDVNTEYCSQRMNLLVFLLFVCFVFLQITDLPF